MTRQLRSSRKEILVGSFFILTIVVVTFGIFFLKGPGSPISGIEYSGIKIQFSKYLPIKEGTPVKIDGFTCGWVSEVEIDEGRPPIFKALIRKAWLKSLKYDAWVSIKTEGLFDNIFISLNSGTSSKEFDTEKVIEDGY